MFFTGNTLGFKQASSKWLKWLLILLPRILDTRVSCEKLYDRPIIGILPEKFVGDKGKFQPYISGSYAKFVENAGARVAVLRPDQPKDYYLVMLKKMNGVLLAGQDFAASRESGHNREYTINMILDTVRQLNDQGIHFPVWGIGVGFVEIVNYFANEHDTDWMDKCSCKGFLSNVDISELIDPKSTQLFAEMDEFHPDITEVMKKNKIAMHHHEFCIDYFKWDKNKQLGKNLVKLSRTDFFYNSFVSTFEHRVYPIFGTIWQPERNQFEFDYDKDKGNHDFSAVLTGQYLGNFFVKEACKNNQSFVDFNDEVQNLLYNYFNPDYDKEPISIYDMIYLIDY